MMVKHPDINLFDKVQKNLTSVTNFALYLLEINNITGLIFDPIDFGLLLNILTLQFIMHMLKIWVFWCS